MKREKSFGQGYQPTWVDRFGIWLSLKQIQRYTPALSGKRIGDFGCGYHATLSTLLLPDVAQVTLVDVALSEFLQKHPKTQAIQGHLPDIVPTIPDNSLDVILCISVLEHLWEPLEILRQFYRILTPNGTCILNVPSWRGKIFLEFSAFKLGLSPPEEMDDHKMYYNVADLWPLLVTSGFKPSHIKCFSHKFGLNTFASCQK